MRDYVSFLDPFFDSFNFKKNEERLFMPVDLKEEKEQFVLTMNCPGVKKENIGITLNDDSLRIKVDFRKEKEEKSDEKFLLREIRRGVVERSFYVDPKTKFEDISASYVDGVLTLIIKKVKKEETSHIISIN